MSNKPLRGKFISPTGALQPECETAAISQIMAFVKTIDLEEMADFDGEYRVEKYAHLYPKPDSLRSAELAWNSLEFFDQFDPEDQSFLADLHRERDAYEEGILAVNDTALDSNTFFEIQDRLRQKERDDELQDLIDEDPDGIGHPASITLVYEGERSNGEVLKDFFADEGLVRAFKAEKPDLWADVEDRIAKQADMVPVKQLLAVPTNG